MGNYFYMEIVNQTVEVEEVCHFVIYQDLTFFLRFNLRKVEATRISHSHLYC